MPASTIKSVHLELEEVLVAPLVFADPEDPVEDVFAPEVAEEPEPEVAVGVGADPVV